MTSTPFFLNWSFLVTILDIVTWPNSLLDKTVGNFLSVVSLLVINMYRHEWWCFLCFLFMLATHNPHISNFGSGKSLTLALHFDNVIGCSYPVTSFTRPLPRMKTLYSSGFVGHQWPFNFISVLKCHIFQINCNMKF